MCHMRRSDDASLAYYTNKKNKTGRDLAIVAFKNKEGAAVRQLLRESKYNG